MALNFLAVKVERETVDNNLIYENPKHSWDKCLNGDLCAITFL